MNRLGWLNEQACGKWQAIVPGAQRSGMASNKMTVIRETYRL